MRWGYLGRLSVAGAIFVAAVYAWRQASSADTLVASVACVAALVATAGSALYSEVYGRPLTRGFLYLHAVLDLLLVTAVVHVTGGLASHFAALYILVIVGASLLLPGRGGLLVTGLALSCYLADGLLGHDAAVGPANWLQLGVFGAVAAISAVIGARLQEIGANREELTAELVQFRVRASDILRTIRSGIVTVAADGRLLYANPAASALLGIELRRSTGRRVLPAIAVVSPELAAALERGLAGGQRTRAEGTITRGEHSHPIGVTTTVSAEEGRGVTVTAIFQDISEGKRLEALHTRAERLEAVAALSASLAHEIKNPLASIRSAVEQLASMPRAGEDERVLGGLIVRESDRLARLLTEFLDFARVRVRQIARVDLAVLVEDAAVLVRAHPDCAAGVAVRCRVPDTMVVEGDEDLLHRAVFNLLLNAVQATPAPGEVVVELAPVEQDALPAGLAFDLGAVALRVSDTGAGIAPEVRDRMFEPFITTKPGGTGLGLPVVHRAIEAHEGAVFVDSDARGTRFTVLLPVRQAGVEGEAEPDGEAGNASAGVWRLASGGGGRGAEDGAGRVGARGAPPESQDHGAASDDRHRNSAGTAVPALRPPPSAPTRQTPDARRQTPVSPPVPTSTP